MLRSLFIVLTVLIALPAYAQNSCEYANDNECDEARYGGQGYCDDGTDTNDCNLLSAGIANDSCTFANDGECDEYRYGGGGSCVDGSDTTDCAIWQVQRESDFLARANALGLSDPDIGGLGDNTCRWNNDGECDDPTYGGSGACDIGTDATDCLPFVETSTELDAGLGGANGNNTCVFANDGDCDELRYGGGGFCDAGTDSNDCSANIGTDLTATPTAGDACEYANDSECDEARFGGGGYCDAGTDESDCRQLALGLDDDSCDWANDGECDEMRYGGGGTCLDGSDATDCDMFGTSPEALERLLALVPATMRAQLGDDSCQYAVDGECDDVTFGGTTYCDAGTDASDCRALALGGEDSCRWANDGECDEYGLGASFCTSGTDVTDCAPVAFMRNRDDSCATAFDGICNEPTDGDNTCAIFSDTADCLGRARPAQLENHFFGRDDRFLVDTTQMPWRAIGSLRYDGDAGCTGTLIGPALVLTAAHCVTDTGESLNLPTSFMAGLSRGDTAGEANVLGAVFAPDYTDETFDVGGGNGNDWALVMLDRDLGSEVGFLDIHELTAQNLAQIGRSGLIVNQAGYSWDTGDNMSGNQGCRIVEAFEDNSIIHECDTAKGDSGSPFLLNVDGTWKIIAVDSQFFGATSDKTPFTQVNLAVDSRAFAAFAAQQQ